MGTSSSYKGLTGKASRALRDGVDQWSQTQGDGSKSPIPENVVAQALNIPRFPRRPGGSGSAGGGGGAAGVGHQSGGARKQAGPQRNARAYASTASRAANLARAFRDGDREALAKAGLDFDNLSGLPSRAEVVREILSVVCDADMGSDIPAEEQRDIAAHMLDWVLDAELNPSPPDAAAITEYAIGQIIAEIFLSEAGERTSTDAVSREEFVGEVYEASQRLSARSHLTQAGASQQEIENAIQKGLKFLRRTYARGNG